MGGVCVLVLLLLVSPLSAYYDYDPDEVSNFFSKLAHYHKNLRKYCVGCQ